eukprot:4567029-Pyramimonas_sp.AAC.1
MRARVGKRGKRNTFSTPQRCAGGGPSARPLCVPGSDSAAGEAPCRHQRGCAGGGPSARPLCVPGSDNAVGVVLSRHQRGHARGVETEPAC